MKCPEVRENLAAYLDGEIGGAPRRAMDDHFGRCGPCTAERRAQAAAWALLDLHPVPAADAGGAAFKARVLAAARREGRPAARIRRLPVPLWAAAAAALLAAVVTGVVAHRDGSDPGKASTEISRGESPAAGQGRRASEPPQGLLDDMAVLETMDLLQDDDMKLLDKLAGYRDEDFAPFGG